jgi:hypothetical protein
MAILDSEAIPRANATPEQLRALGGAMAEWARRECSDAGILQFISREALADLSNGNLPPPYLEQYQEMRNENRGLTGDRASMDPVAQVKERQRFKEAMGDAGLRRTIFFQVRGTYATRKGLFANLRQNLPAELVEDVLVSGWSWDG